MATFCVSKTIVILLFFAVKRAVCDINNTDGSNEFRSDYTYYPQVGYWFKVHSIPVEWHTARLLCHYEGAELASPLNAEIMEIIKQLVATHEPKLKVYFSGIHQTFGSGVYTSIDGIPLEKLFVKNWAVDEPNAFNNNQQCLVYSNDDTIWDYNCPESYPYICYRKYSENDKLTECGTIDKAYKLERQTGHCYKYHKHGDTWERAQKICRAEGGYLAIINSAAEAEGLKNLVKRSPRPLYTTVDTVALGYREWGQANAWWTINGQTLEEAGFEDWCNGCPKSEQEGDTRQSCGGFNDGELNNIYCDKPYAFICEKHRDSLTNMTSSSHV